MVVCCAGGPSLSDRRTGVGSGDCSRVGGGVAGEVWLVSVGEYWVDVGALSQLREELCKKFPNHKCV